MKLYELCHQIDNEDSSIDFEKNIYLICLSFLLWMLIML
ncbi:hypothetical protein C7M51_00198 [Mixta intestinalis]|uniref:Uncharacterized protein n=1 Tax=Mixta intestinalis TaxID=1615494 RepID=A0A6P1PVL8_9GAMM|nr:hypothetical protein C7M51_00198 [Mixta intestinalis]